MALDFSNPNHIIATAVLIIEIVLVLMLLLARYNIRRLKINNHHILVYSIVIINTIIIAFWMLPGELRLIQRIIDGSDPLRFWHVLIHGFLGTISILGGVLLCSVFILKVIKRDLLPLGLIKRMRPIMLTTFIFWLLTFIFGVYIYINKYLL